MREVHKTISLQSFTSFALCIIRSITVCPFNDLRIFNFNLLDFKRAVIRKPIFSLIPLNKVFFL